MKKEMRNACYKCKYRGEVPGSAHSRCLHPDFKETVENPLLEVFSTLLTARNKPLPKVETKSKIKVVGDPHGIRNGWFNHPFNFDPVWLLYCEGFTPKEENMSGCSGR